jgi:hypothetical protein
MVKRRMSVRGNVIKGKEEGKMNISKRRGRCQRLGMVLRHATRLSTVQVPVIQAEKGHAQQQYKGNRQRFRSVTLLSLYSISDFPSVSEISADTV